MRIKSHNVFAIIVAAIAIYAIEFVIFALIIPADQYLSFIGANADQVDSSGARMAFGIVPPVLAAIALSMVIKWRGSVGPMQGAMTGVWMAVLFAFGTSLYSFVYGPNAAAYLPVNLAHFVVCYAVAGAILGAWK